MNSAGHFKNLSPSYSIGSKLNYQRLGPSNSEVKFNLKGSNLSHILHSSRSHEPSPDMLKIQEAYQYLKLRNIGCTRTEAISLASKFKLNREVYLSDLLPQYQEKWKKSLNEEKFKSFYSADDGINIDSLTKICENKRSELKGKKRRRINLRIVNRKNIQDASGDRSFKDTHCESIENGKFSGKLTRVSTLNEVVLPKISKEFYKNKSESMIGSGCLSLRQISNDSQRTVEEEYLVLMEKKKSLKEKIKTHKSQIEKQKSIKMPDLASNSFVKKEKKTEKILKKRSSKLN